MPWSILTIARARGEWQNQKARKCSDTSSALSTAYSAPVREGWSVVRARARDGERGASLVEFALVVPLLTLFLFGIVQFGLAFDKKQSINSGAREGARLAALPVSTVASIDAAVENAFDGLLDGTVTTTVSVGATAFTAATDKPCEGREGQTVVVVATVPHVLTIPFFGAPVLTLEGRGEFRCERGA